MCSYLLLHLCRQCAGVAILSVWRRIIVHIHIFTLTEQDSTKLHQSWTVPCKKCFHANVSVMFNFLDPKSTFRMWNWVNTCNRSKIILKKLNDINHIDDYCNNNNKLWWDKNNISYLMISYSPKMQFFCMICSPVTFTS